VLRAVWCARPSGRRRMAYVGKAQKFGHYFDALTLYVSLSPTTRRDVRNPSIMATRHYITCPLARHNLYRGGATSSIVLLIDPCLTSMKKLAHDHASLLLSRWPGQLSATEYMEMQVVHTLTSLLAIIDDHSESWIHSQF